MPSARPRKPQRRPVRTPQPAPTTPNLYAVPSVRSRLLCTPLRRAAADLAFGIVGWSGFAWVVLKYFRVV